MKTTLLIDADTLVMQIGTAVQRTIKWPDEIFSMYADGNEAWNQIQISIEDLRKAVHLDGWTEDPEIILAFSDPTRKYFRHSLLPSYKGNRKNREGPMLLGYLKDRMKESYITYVLPKLEADDILGILGTNKDLVPDTAILVSVDKDLKTIPGFHYNPAKPDQGVYKISQSEADTNHMYQTLVGDSADGYSGCPGVGPVRAKRLLDKNLGWKGVFTSFKLAGVAKQDALIQARVARILRSNDYNLSNKEIKLWNPPSQCM